MLSNGAVGAESFAAVALTAPAVAFECSAASLRLAVKDDNAARLPVIVRNCRREVSCESKSSGSVLTGFWDTLQASCENSFFVLSSVYAKWGRTAFSDQVLE
jgi:hypothetical protein